MSTAIVKEWLSSAFDENDSQYHFVYQGLYIVLIQAVDRIGGEIKQAWKGPVDIFTFPLPIFPQRVAPYHGIQNIFLALAFLDKCSIARAVCGFAQGAIRFTLGNQSAESSSGHFWVLFITMSAPVSPVF